MKRLMLIIGLIGLLFIIIGCGDPSTKPYVYDGVEMLLNGSVEVDPIGVWNKFENAGINYGWASVAEAGSNSLKITTSSDNTGSDWYQVVSTDIPIGKRLKLTAKIRTDNVAGDGVAIAIRADDAVPNLTAEMFVTTEDKISITGSRDWTVFQVELKDKITANIQSITVFLILLPSSTGTVYFDDISLIH